MYIFDELEVMFGNVACEVDSMLTDVAYTWRSFWGTLDKRKDQLRKEKLKLAKRKAKLKSRKAKAMRCTDKAKRAAMKRDIWCEEQAIRDCEKILGGKR